MSNYLAAKSNLQHIVDISSNSRIDHGENLSDISEDASRVLGNPKLTPLEVPKAAYVSSTKEKKNDKEKKEEFVIHKIVSHCTKTSKKPRFSEVVELLYRIGWYFYRHSEDTSEPIAHIPR